MSDKLSVTLAPDSPDVAHADTAAGNRFEQLSAWLLPFHPVFGLMTAIGLSFRGRRVVQGLRTQRADLIAWGLLVVVGVISVLGAYDIPKAAVNFLVPFLFIWLYGLGRWAVKSPTKFLLAMLHGTAVFALIMIIARLFLIDFRIGDFVVLGRFNGRGEVLGMKSNGLAMVLEAGVIGGIGLLLIARNTRDRIWGLTMALLCLLATGITLSRGAMVGIAAGTLTLGLMLSPRALAVTGAAGTGLLVFSSRIRTRALSIFNFENPDGRVEIWSGVLRMLKDHLWFGVGPGNFSVVYPNYALPKWAHTRSAHSNYLNFVAAWGILGGLLMFGWQAWVMIRSLMRGLSDDQKIMFAILITFGTHVLFDDLFTAYWPFLLGCLENPAYDREREAAA